MGQLQERITSTRKGSVTSVQAIYVPADDLTDPAPASVFAHLNATTMLSRVDLREGHLPGRRPARLDLDDPQARHRRRGALQRRQRRSRRSCSATRSCRTSSRSSASTSSPTRTRSRCSARARSSASCRSRSTSPSSSPARRASTSRSPRRSARFREILDGEHDDLPESAFLLKGAIDDVVEAANKRLAERRDHGPHQVPRRGPHPRGRGLQRRGRDGLDPHDGRLDRHPGQPPAAAGMLEPTELRLYKSESDIVRFAQGEGYLQVVRRRASWSSSRRPSRPTTSTRRPARPRCARAEEAAARRRGRLRGAAARPARRSAGRRS